MKRSVCVVTLCSVALTLGLSAEPQLAAVEKLLANARQALGSDRGVTAVTSFSIKGSIKTNTRGESGTFEITYERPGKFVQVEHRTFLDPGDTVGPRPSNGGPHIERIIVKMGFDGDEPIYERNPPQRSWQLSTRDARTLPAPTPEQLRTVLPKAREAFVNLTMGLFASSFPGAPVQFKGATGAESGTTVLVEGPDFTRTLVFNPTTHLPERLNGVRYLDYRDIGGRKVPTRIHDGRDEWIIEEFVVTPR
jgi:hypothetical protein